MANTEEGSVAPTERVNIVYRPATAGAKEDVELPLKVLVAGDFTGAPDTRPIEEREPTNIDKDNFNDVLKAHNVNVAFKVPDKISGEADREVNVNLAFQTIQDFNPEKIVAQIPELKALLDMREALTALKGPLANTPEFKNKLQNLIKDESARNQILGELGISTEEDKNGRN